MANRVLAGNRSTGGYGFYVSRLTSDVLDCASDKLMFNTNSAETGSSFFSAGHFQVVPVSGGVGSTAPVTSATPLVVAAGATASPTYVNIASTQIMLWGSSPEGAGAGEGEDRNETYTYSSLGSLSATLTNNGSESRSIRTVTFNMLSALALF